MRIHKVRGFLAYSYILESPEVLALVDAGFVGQGNAILKRIAEIGRDPSDISLAVISHGHIDHYGGLPKLQEVADFDVLVHPAHAERVAEGVGADISPGIPLWAKGYERVAARGVPHLDSTPIRRVISAEPNMRLDEWGVDGRVLFTPGHSEGDITLLSDDEEAFVGDLVQGPRMRFMKPDLPAMALDLDEVLRSWDLVLSEGARIVYPAHGKPAGAFQVRRSWRAHTREQRGSAS